MPIICPYLHNRPSKKSLAHKSPPPFSIITKVKALVVAPQVDKLFLRLPLVTDRMTKWMKDRGAFILKRMKYILLATIYSNSKRNSEKCILFFNGLYKIIWVCWTCLCCDKCLAEFSPNIGNALISYISFVFFLFKHVILSLIYSVKFYFVFHF